KIDHIMKILIVGAGPIGCYIGQLLKRQAPHIEVKLIEEHAEIGKPVHCAGLVSKDVITDLKITLDQDCVINQINGAEFLFDHNSFKINRENVAVVIDRVRFDQALSKGLDIDCNTRFVGLEKNSKGYLVETDQGDYYADIVIGADGAHSTVRKAGGFKEELELLRGVQFRIRVPHQDHNVVKVYLKKPFFAWFISENPDIIRAGIISENPYHDLMDLLKAQAIEGEIIEKFAGLLPLGRCGTQRGSIFLVGDAACQVKPLTHGGIYYGMRCAEILVDCIVKDKLADYERLWKGRFEREIQIAHKVKTVYQHLSDKNLENVFCFLKDNVDVLEKFGDFENHSKVISIFLKNPRLKTLLGKIFIDIVKDIPL
nr:NAD(P)/FAD-dependent oxidoreductase [Candidatus Omnitrophota bacterium]